MRSLGTFLHAKAILRRRPDEIALLLGKGINRASKKSGGIGWNELMETLIKEAAVFARNPRLARRQLLRLLKENERQHSPASFPEVFDLIEATCGLLSGVSPGEDRRFPIQLKISELLQKMKPGTPHRSVVEWASRKGVPILTTNYDHCLQDAVGSIGCERHRFGQESLDLHSIMGPYYAPTVISDPLNSFAIWHIHGDQILGEASGRA